MVVLVAHELPVQEARKRIDRHLDEVLKRSLPAGLKLSGVEREWKGDTLTASAKASVGFFSLNLSGTLRLSAKTVTVDLDVPAIAKAFVNEQDIEAGVKRELEAILAK